MHLGWNWLRVRHKRFREQREREIGRNPQHATACEKTHGFLDTLLCHFCRQVDDNSRRVFVLTVTNGKAFVFVVHDMFLSYCNYNLFLNLVFVNPVFHRRNLGMSTSFKTSQIIESTFF